MFKRLLVPLDGSDFAEQALPRAGAIARKSNATVHLLLAHVRIPYAGYEDVPWFGEQTSDEREYLARVASGPALSSLNVTWTVLKGDPVETICREAAEGDTDLIVMASHGRTGLSRTWIGSVAHGVIRKSGVPVLLVRPAEHKPGRADESSGIRRILMTIDGSSLSEEIIPVAMEIARSEGASVTVVRVVEPVMSMPPITSMPLAFSPGAYDDNITSNLVAAAGREMQLIAQSLKKVASVVETRVIVAQSAARAILDIAKSENADVIAMATHGRGASRLLLGSVADKVLRGSDAMMLLQCPSARRINGLVQHAPNGFNVRSA